MVWFALLDIAIIDPWPYQECSWCTDIAVSSGQLSLTAGQLRVQLSLLKLSYSHIALCTYFSVFFFFSFKAFMPLSYGMSGPKAHSPDSVMYGLKWLSTWDI